MAKNTMRKKGVKFNKNFTPMTDPVKKKIRSIIQQIKRPSVTRAQKIIDDRKELERELQSLRRGRIARGMQ